LELIASEAMELRLQPSSGTRSGTGQIIGLDIAFARDVRDGEPQRANELAADPVKRVEARASTTILAGHLSDDNFGIGIDVNGSCFQGHRALQRFEQREVFRDIIVLTPNPLGDTDFFATRITNHNANASRPRIAQGPTIDKSD